MSVERFNLRHQIDDFKSVVGLLSERVAEQVQLLQECVVHQLDEEFVKISELIVANKQSVEEFVLFESVNIVEQVALADDLLAAEVTRNTVEVFQLFVN